MLVQRARKLRMTMFNPGGGVIGQESTVVYKLHNHDPFEAFEDIWVVMTPKSERGNPVEMHFDLIEPGADHFVSTQQPLLPEAARPELTLDLTFDDSDGIRWRRDERSRVARAVTAR